MSVMQRDQFCNSDGSITDYEAQQDDTHTQDTIVGFPHVLIV